MGIKKKDNSLSHTFVICAYKDSDYLPDCIESILNQTTRSDVIISSSTPTDRVRRIAQKYDIRLYEHTRGGSIGKDWNYGFHIVNTKYVTIAHQDDVYLPEFAEKTIDRMERHEDCIVAFTNYSEIDKETKLIKRNINLKIKDIMLVPVKLFPGSRWIRKRIFSMGNPICCPSVTYNKQLLNNFLFSDSLSFVVDWDAMVRINDKKANWQYNPEPLLLHRIHSDSETTSITNSGIRVDEELQMFELFWPKPVAKWIEKIYRQSANTNNCTIKSELD